MQAPIVVVETSVFVRQASEIWSDDERETFVDFIARNPTTGDVIPDTGGVRKLRWERAGIGKRGGVRVIYFYYNRECPLYLLMVYAKARQENLKPEEKRKVRAFVDVIKGRRV
jgi:hypothetical protein